MKTVLFFLFSVVMFYTPAKASESNCSVDSIRMQKTMNTMVLSEKDSRKVCLTKGSYFVLGTNGKDDTKGFEVEVLDSEGEITFTAGSYLIVRK